VIWQRIGHPHWAKGKAFVGTEDGLTLRTRIYESLPEGWWIVELGESRLAAVHGETLAKKLGSRVLHATREEMRKLSAESIVPAQKGAIG